MAIGRQTWRDDKRKRMRRVRVSYCNRVITRTITRYVRTAAGRQGRGRRAQESESGRYGRTGSRGRYDTRVPLPVRARPSAFTRVRSADGCTFFPPPQPQSLGQRREKHFVAVHARSPPPDPPSRRHSAPTPKARSRTAPAAAVPSCTARHQVACATRVYGARLPSTMRPHQLPLRSLCSLVLSLSVVTAATGSPRPHSTDDPATTTAPNATDDSGSGTDRQGDKRIFFDDIFGSVSYEPEEKLPVSNCTCNCGVPNQEIRIVGGRPTGVHRYPWVARLMYEGHFHCGGSLINSDYVLTAAHCVRKLKKSRIRVIFGEHDQSVTTDGETITRVVSSIVRHRNFDVNSYNHDVALLRLRKSVSFSKSVRPICLPSASREPSGKLGTVVGWGRVSEGGNLADIVQEVQVPILSLAQCRASKYRPQRITANMICAGKGVEDSCQGDSGGPLLVNSDSDDKLEIVGIVSWGVGCGRPGYPGVYTRVTKYLDWIQKNMRDTCACIR